MRLQQVKIMQLIKPSWYSGHYRRIEEDAEDDKLWFIRNWHTEFLTNYWSSLPILVSPYNLTNLNDRKSDVIENVIKSRDDYNV